MRSEMPLVATGMAQASLSTGSRSHLLLPSRDTCTSLYIVAARRPLLQGDLCNDWVQATL